MKAVDQLIDEIERLIERYRHEGDISYAEIVGALELIKIDVIAEAVARAEEEDND